MKLRNKAGKMIVNVGVGINGFWVENDAKMFTAFNKSLKSLAEEYEDIPTSEEESYDLSSWAQEVKVRELPSGLKIADRNYFAADKAGGIKTKFTWYEATERFKDDPNWRLPTPQELAQIVADLGYDEQGIFDGKRLAECLGTDALSDYEADGDSLYWSSSAVSSEFAYNLYFYNDDVSPGTDNSSKYSGCAVRCVARNQGGDEQ